MTLTASTMLSLGTQALDFNLPNVVTRQNISLATFADKKSLLVMFVSQHCPFVKHIKYELAKLGKDYLNSDLGIVAISSNDAKKYPDDAPISLEKMALELDLEYPICYDESQDVAKSYTAACTPDFFLFDGKRKLVYRGQLDNSRPSNGLPVTGADLRAAIDSVLVGKEIIGEQKPSIGCNIKWISGNEPNYLG
jgi:thioredoxin-related protein